MDSDEVPTIVIVWSIVVVLSIPIILLTGEYLARRCEEVDKKKGQVYKNKEAYDVHKKLHAFGLVWMPPEVRVGGVDVTDRVKTSIRQDGTSRTVRTIVAIDDETGRTRRMIQELPHDPTANRIAVNEFRDWQEFADTKPDIEALLESPPPSPPVSPHDSPQTSRSTSPEVKVPPPQPLSSLDSPQPLSSLDSPQPLSSLDSPQPLSSPTPLQLLSSPPPPVSLPSSSPVQETPATILQDILNRYEMVEESETKTLDEFDLMGVQYPTHVIRTLRPVWNRDSAIKQIDTLHTTTTFDPGATLDDMYNQLWHMDKHFSTVPNFEYDHQMRFEVEYESGKRDVHRSLDDWAKAMLEWLNEYDEQLAEKMPKVKKITVYRCGKEDYSVLRRAGYKVKSGQGFPSMLMHSNSGTLVKMDLMRTNGSCGAAAFFIWWALTSGDGKLFHCWRTYDDMLNSWTEFKDRCKSLHIQPGVQWCTDDFYRVCSTVGVENAKLVQYFEDDERHMAELMMLQPRDFTSGTCHLLISKSMHATVVWPLQLLTPTWQTIIINKEKRTYDRRIVKKKSTQHTQPYEHINTLDIESLVLDNGVHTPQLLCFYYKGTAYFVSNCDNPIDSFMQWVMQLNESVEFWAHNLSYDGSFFNSMIFKYCNNQLTQPAKILSNTRGIIKCKYHLTNGRVLTLRDSCSHLPASLDELGRSYCNRGKIEYDVMQLKQPEQFWTRECIEYCVADCILLHDVLRVYERRAVDKYSLNPLRYATLSAYAKNSCLLSSEHNLYTLAPVVDEYLRSGYHGGRTEALVTGTTSGQMQLLDFNSHYPACMTEDLPYGKPVHIPSSTCTNLPSESLVQWLQQHRGFYTIHVLYSPPHLKYHLFGSVDGHGRYTFTDATNQTYYAEEADTIIYALTLGYKLRLLEGYSFKYSLYLRNWVERMYQDKVAATVAGDAVGRSIAKFILNSAYGAFGTKWKERKQQVTHGSRYVKQLMNNETLGYNSGTTINNIWAGTETTNLLLDDVNVAVSSCVTSRGRLKLYQTMMQMDSLACEVLYVDTDSLIVQPKDPTVTSSLIHPTQLGALKLEAQLSQLTLLAPKAYSYVTVDGKVVSKLKGLNLSQCTPTPNVPQLLSDTLTGTSTTVHTTKLFRPKSLFFTPTPIISKLLKYTLTCK